MRSLRKTHEPGAGHRGRHPLLRDPSDQRAADPARPGPRRRRARRPDRGRAAELRPGPFRRPRGRGHPGRESGHRRGEPRPGCVLGHGRAGALPREPAGLPRDGPGHHAQSPSKRPSADRAGRLAAPCRLPARQRARHAVCGRELRRRDRAGGLCACAGQAAPDRRVRAGGEAGRQDRVHRHHARRAPDARRLPRASGRDMAFAGFETLDGYARLLDDNGCTVVEREDLTRTIGPRSCGSALRCTARFATPLWRASAPSTFARWDDTYAFFVGLFA